MACESLNAVNYPREGCRDLRGGLGHRNVAAMQEERLCARRCAYDPLCRQRIPTLSQCNAVTLANLS